MEKALLDEVNVYPQTVPKLKINPGGNSFYTKEDSRYRRLFKFELQDMFENGQTIEENILHLGMESKPFKNC